jgi:tripartite-type tricarboxylate transporter receptor subunit TctC
LNNASTLRPAVRTIIFAIALSLSSAAQAAGVEDFYRGRTVSLIIGFSPGTGYDIYARLLARFIGRHIPATRRSLPRTCRAPAASRR